MSAVDTKGDQKYWFEGQPFEGLRLQASQVGSQKFWADGHPAEDITPLLNADTGKFFLLFE